MVWIVEEFILFLRKTKGEKPRHSDSILCKLIQGVSPQECRVQPCLAQSRSIWKRSLIFLAWEVDHWFHCSSMNQPGLQWILSFLFHDTVLENDTMAIVMMGGKGGCSKKLEASTVAYSRKIPSRVDE